ncbi:MAG: class II aldolase/adducin family protein [Candidatus Omnitrophica bacterium]|nr:class II aldolase/adducin family protein [Candidatus Omnitrophota bacterium]
MKNKIIETGKLLWDKGLVTGFNGNISARVDDGTLLITATGTCLGYLKPQDVLLMRISGEVIGDGNASTEKLMHTAIYKNFPEVKAVVHTHPTYTNGFFLANTGFTPKTFEAKFYLGEVKSVEQTTPSVTDTAPVIQELKATNIVVLRNHGVVAMGPDLFHAFVLIQELEEQVKMDLVNVHYMQGPTGPAPAAPRPSSRKYKLFSKEQIEEIVRLVNSDAQMQELGSKTAMNMDLAVCLQETGDTYSFKFRNGKITETGRDGNAEFLITANDAIWRAVFNRQIDPFVATTQKKMNLRGDFARISKWYAPCSRIFQLWAQVPVE